MTDLAFLIAIGTGTIAAGIVGAFLRKRADRAYIWYMERQNERLRGLILERDTRIAVLEEQQRVLIETPAVVLRQHYPATSRN